MKKHRVTQTATAVLVSVATATSVRAAEKTVVVSGEYFYNFEFAYITPEGSSEQWCIKGDMSNAELSERWGITTVKVEGTLSPEGKYGNLGVCKRIFSVVRVLRATNLRGHE